MNSLKVMILNIEIIVLKEKKKRSHYVNYICNIA